MKRGDFLINSARSSALLLLASALSAGAATSGENPYSSIVERNTFGLRPPTPVNPISAAPVVQPSNIKLQGITTILGRKQVLLKVSVPPRPPEGPKEVALVLSEGMRDGDVEVLSIDPASGEIRLVNAGTPLSLNMKDNAEKPTPGAAPAALGGGGAPPSALPNGIPTMSLPPPAAPPAAPNVPTTIGGGERNIPTRALRTNPNGANNGMNGAAMPGSALGTPGSPSGSSYQPPVSPLSVDEQMAALAVQQQAAANGGGDGTGALLPPIPHTYRNP